MLKIIISVLMGILVFCTGVTSANATGVYDLDYLDGSSWILDKGDVLSRITEGNLNSVLQKLSDQTGNQVRLVTIHRLDYGESAQTFVNQLFDKWFPESDQKENQTLLVIDTVTNQAAIKTGAKSQNLLTPDIITSIVDETLGYPLQQGDKYNQALSDVSDRLIAVLSGQPDPGPPVITENISVEGTFKTKEETERGRSGATFWIITFLVGATVIPMATYYFYIWYQG